jgi:hydroxyacylglutathione hydrolase
MLKLQTLAVGEYGTNCYLLTCPETGRAILVDPGGDAEAILDLCGDAHVTRIHPADVGLFGVEADFDLEDGKRMVVGRRYVRLVHIPGHTPGSVALRFDRRAIVGDAIFPGGPGHTGKPEALQTLLISLQRTVFTWPDDTLVYSGHGNHTTVGAERPAFQEFLARPRPPDMCGDVTWR